MFADQIIFISDQLNFKKCAVGLLVKFIDCSAVSRGEGGRGTGGGGGGGAHGAPAPHCAIGANKFLYKLRPKLNGSSIQRYMERPACLHLQHQHCSMHHVCL